MSFLSKAAWKLKNWGKTYHSLSKQCIKQQLLYNSLCAVRMLIFISALSCKMFILHVWAGCFDQMTAACIATGFSDIGFRSVQSAAEQASYRLAQAESSQGTLCVTNVTNFSQMQVPKVWGSHSSLICQTVLDSACKPFSRLLGSSTSLTS